MERTLIAPLEMLNLLLTIAAAILLYQHMRLVKLRDSTLLGANFLKIIHLELPRS
jgi:hypothetical protein